MSGLAECGGLNCSGSRCVPTSAAAWGSDLTAARMATAEHLMARGSGLTIPRLDGVPREHQMWQGEQAAARGLTGDELREEADEEREVEEILLGFDPPAVDVDYVGDALKGVERDPDG